MLIYKRVCDVWGCCIEETIDLRASCINDVFTLRYLAKMEYGLYILR